MISCNFEERFPPKFQCVSSMTFPRADPIFSQIGRLGFEQSFFKNSNNERFWTNPLQPGYRMHRVPNRFGPTMISWNFDKRFPPKFVCVSSMTFSTADPNFIQIGRLGIELSFIKNSEGLDASYPGWVSSFSKRLPANFSIILTRILIKICIRDK